MSMVSKRHTWRGWEGRRGGNLRVLEGWRGWAHLGEGLGIWRLGKRGGMSWSLGSEGGLGISWMLGSRTGNLGRHSEFAKRWHDQGLDLTGWIYVGR